MTKLEKKQFEMEKLMVHFESYKKVVLVDIQKVESLQIQQIRKTLRGKGVLIVGKNTRHKKVIKDHSEKYPKLLKLLPYLNGNIGLIFTNVTDLNEIKDIIISNEKQTSAKLGDISDRIVMIHPQSTGLDPTRTSYFASLNIATKIRMGQIEILNHVKLLDVGDRVTPSIASILERLNILPFRIGMKMKYIYDDGNIYPPEIIDMKRDEFIELFQEGISDIMSISLETDYLTQVTLDPLFLFSLQDIFSISLYTNCKIDNLCALEDYLEKLKPFID